MNGKITLFKSVRSTDIKNVFASDYVKSFLYAVGKTVQVKDVNKDPKVSCGSGGKCGDDNKIIVDKRGKE